MRIHVRRLRINTNESAVYITVIFQFKRLEFVLFHCRVQSLLLLRDVQLQTDCF